VDISTSRLAVVVHQERLAQAADARKWAQRSVRISLRDRVRLPLSTRLIRLGEQLRAPAAPIEAHS
jgi:hypothetical protein